MVVVDALTALARPDMGQDLRQASGCERIYRDHGVSGTRASRPELDRVLDRLSRGDEVVVWKLEGSDAIRGTGSSSSTRFKAKGIKFRSLRDGITTDPDTELGGAVAQAMITIISAFAQLERDQLSERTRAGMAVAAANGRRAARREVTAEDPKVKRAREPKAQGLKPANIGRVIGVGRATVYRYLSLDPS